MVRMTNPVHPGEILKDYLDEMGLTVGRLAKAIFLPYSSIEQIVECELEISADIALRFAKVFGTSAEFWMNLQRNFELSQVARDENLSGDLERITRFIR